MAYEIAVPDSDVDDALNKAAAAADAGVSSWPGMTYEQGVDSALRWVTGQSDDHPMVDE